MPFQFGDSFDLYAAPADAGAGYWDSVTVGSATLVAGRFAGSQALNIPTTATILTKSSAVNDAVHHLVVAFRQTTTLTGTNIGTYFQLSDAATNQVCICFRSDGAILLTSATPAGTVLDTYTGAVTAANTWFAFEVEVVINNTTGSWAVRKNGNTSNDRALGGLNTRPGANAYANKLTVAASTSVPVMQIDDLFWQSGAATGVWLSDIRCYTRMPASDASTQFARAPSPATSTMAIIASVSDPTGTSRYTPFTPGFTGTVGSIVVQVNTGFTGNMKCALFADGASNPGAVLGSATTVVNPIAGANTCTFGTPVAVVKGTQYWWGVSHDVTATVSTGAGGSGRNATTVTYAAFPSASPTNASSGAVAGTVNITPTVNSEMVNETLQDGTTSYVYDATPGHADFYNIAALSPSPATVVAVTTRGFIEKSDAGARTGTVQLKSGGTTVAAPTVSLSTSFGWSWRTDVTNPNGSVAWTASAVDSCTIGPAVVS